MTITTSASEIFQLHGVQIRLVADDMLLGDAARAFLRPAHVDHVAADVDDGQQSGQIILSLLRSEAPQHPPAQAHLWMDVDGLRLLADERDVYLLIDGHYMGLLRTSEHAITIWVSDADDTDAWTIGHMLIQPLLCEALRAFGLVSLHAAALADGDRVAIFPAVSGSGKTTLALALLRGGFKLLSDDSPFVRREGNTIVARAFAEALNVTGETVAFFPELRAVWQQHIVSGEEGKAAIASEKIYGDCLGVMGEVEAVIFPEACMADRTVVETMAKAEALVRLLPLTMTSASPAYTLQQFRLLSDLVRTTPCYRMRTGQDFAEQPMIVRNLLRGRDTRE